MGFSVDVTDLRSHASHIDGCTDWLSSAADAAAVRQLTPDTYGLLSQPVVPILQNLQDAGHGAIAAGSTGMVHVGTAVRRTADDYERMENENRSKVLKSAEQHEEPPEQPGPLVVPPEERSKQAVVFTKIDRGHWHEGVDLFEGIADVLNGVTSGDWSEVGIGAVSTVIEGVNVGLDPLSTLTKYAVGWLLEHLEPWQQLLDMVTARREVVAAETETWENIAEALREVRTNYRNAVEKDLTDWTGDGSEQYHAAANNAVGMFDALEQSAGGIAAAMELFGQVVDIVRGLINDLLAELVATLVARLPVWTAEASTVVGLPAVEAQASALIARWFAKALRIVRKLIGSYQKLAKRLDPLKDILEKLKENFERLDKGGKVIDAGRSPSSAEEAGRRAEELRKKRTYAEEA